jgi:hypothetical protein
MEADDFESVNIDDSDYIRLEWRFQRFWIRLLRFSSFMTANSEEDWGYGLKLSMLPEQLYAAGPALLEEKLNLVRLVMTIGTNISWSLPHGSSVGIIYSGSCNQEILCFEL